MATVRYKVCDRCLKEINEHSEKRAFIKRKYKISWIIRGFIYESDTELCSDCAKKLEEFMKTKEEEQ